MMDETKKSLEKLGINELHDDYPKRDLKMEANTDLKFLEYKALLHLNLF